MTTHTARTCTDGARELAEVAQEERNAIELEQYVEEQDAQYQLEREAEGAERREFYADRANREDSYITASLRSNLPRSFIQDPFALQSEAGHTEDVGGREEGEREDTRIEIDLSALTESEEGDVVVLRTAPTTGHDWDGVPEAAPPPGFQPLEIDLQRYRGRGGARACKVEAI